MLPAVNPTETIAWQKLSAHYLEMQAVHMRELFAEDLQRFEKFHLMMGDILVDFSKNIIDKDTLLYLTELANECQLQDAIQAMFQGVKINQTENRLVLHVALRNRSNQPLLVDGEDVMPLVNSVLKQVKEFSDKLIQQQWKGFTGKPITDIINIGIGYKPVDNLKLAFIIKNVANWEWMPRPGRFEQPRSYTLQVSYNFSNFYKKKPLKTSIIPTQLDINYT